MQGRIFKSIVVQMIGLASTQVALGGFQPVAIGYFIAVWCSRLLRYPLYPIMLVGIYYSVGFLQGTKYALVLFAIMIVFYIMEGKQSRVPIITGTLLGGGVLYTMEMTDIIMSNGGKDAALMATATAVLTMCLSILFYKLIEMFQMPGKGERDKQDKEGYKEKLNSYEERMNSISDAFAKMAKSVEKAVFNQREIFFDMDQCGCVNNPDCIRCNMLIRQNQIYKNKLADSKRIIATQLLEMSKILGESLGNTYDLHGVTDEQLQELTGRFRERGISIQRVVRLDNRRGISEILVTMRAKRGNIVGIKEVEKIVNEVFGMEVEIVRDKRKIIETEMITYRFREKPNFFVLHGLAKSGKEYVSGDNFSCLSLESGQTLLGISDGMGCGIQAYKDSEMVLELLEGLMESGFSEETAIKLINTIFILDGENASPATVDMGIIDMYSGVCDFMKLGAASTYVKRGDWVETIRSTSMPIGGSHNPDIESTTKKLYDGDFVIMMSDGIVESAAKQNKEDMLGKIIMEMEAGKPQDMADRLLDRAKKELGVEDEDDMTVFVTGIWNYAKCS